MPLQQATPDDTTVARGPEEQGGQPEPGNGLPATRPAPSPGGTTRAGPQMDTGAQGAMAMAMDGGVATPDAGDDTGDADMELTTRDVQCAAREVSGEPAMHFHHVHFNTVEPEEDLAFFETFFDAPAVEFCRDPETGRATRATRTKGGYFLYTAVDEPADPTLNTYLEHIGWIHPEPTQELLRLVELGVTLWPQERFQCASAAAGEMACGVGNVLPEYFFYVKAPSGARIEVAKGPGPASSGFGHVHFIQGVDLGFFETVSDGAFVLDEAAIDEVNHVSSSLMESILANEMVVDTRGKPVDHIAYSTTDLMAARERIVAAGIAIEIDIERRPEYGFDSFFVRSPKGIWVEIVADTPFAP